MERTESEYTPQNRIKQVRRSMALNQKEFAGLIGVSARTIQYWETGAREPRSRNLRSLVHASGRPALWLLGEAE